MGVTRSGVVWLANGRIVCGFSDQRLAQTREDLERQNERTVRALAAVRHLRPDRLPVVEDPERCAG